MTTLKFWNTEIEADTDVTKLPGETLLAYLEDLVTEDTWSNGGLLGDGGPLYQFYQRVYNELIKRLSYYPVKDYPL